MSRLLAHRLARLERRALLDPDRPRSVERVMVPSGLWDQTEWEEDIRPRMLSGGVPGWALPATVAEAETQPADCFFLPMSLPEDVWVEMVARQRERGTMPGEHYHQVARIAPQRPEVTT